MRFLIAAAIAMPAAALAVGGDSAEPPSSTDTTTTCENGQVWSPEKQECVNPQESGLLDDDLYQAARELAYAGRYDDALVVLSAMSDPLDDRVLAYTGFIARKTGKTQLSHAYYAQAIARNPGNLLARSYLGQGFVEAGDVAAAKAQLSEIRARAGRGTWAEISLRMAIDSGAGSGY